MNKIDFCGKLTFFKDWPVWLFVYEFFVILFTFGNTAWKLNIIILFLSIFLFSCLGVFFLSKYPQCNKLIIRYIAAIMIFLFFYSPYWSVAVFSGCLSCLFKQEYSILLGILLFIIFFAIGKIINKNISEFWLWIFFIIAMGVSVTFDNFYTFYPTTGKNYLEGMLISFILFQFFFSAFYALLLLPFTWYLIKNRNLQRRKYKQEPLKIFDIIYFVFLTALPWCCIHLMYIYRH